MGVHIGDNKLVITTTLTTFHFYLAKDDINLKHEICFIMKYNELLAEHKIINETRQLLSKCKHGNDIHEHKNIKTNEPHRFFYNLSRRLNLKCLSKHIVLQN